jgi:phosphoenolpyruvate carboxylase
MWQSDDLRVDQPKVADEARNMLFFVGGLLEETVPRLLADMADEARARGAFLPPTARPLIFGNWIGGDRDGNPNVSPATTLDVLVMQHAIAIKGLIAMVQDCVDEVSMSTRLVDVTPELAASLERDLDKLDIDEPHPPSQCRGALPPQAQLRPSEAHQHARSHCGAGGFAARARLRRPR